MKTFKFTKIDEKLYKNISVYYIGYITIKSENILMIVKIFIV